MVVRNCQYPSSATSVARRTAHIRSGRGVRRRGTQTSPGIVRSRAADVEASLRSLGVSVQENPGAGQVRVRHAVLNGPWVPSHACWSEWRPYSCPVLRSLGPGRWLGGVAHVFTDGSSSEDAREPSGCAVVVTMGEQVLLEHGFPCRPSGSNYLAEAVAFLAALLVVPVEVELHIHTDALSVKQSAERGLVVDWAEGVLSGEYAITQRSRVLAGARPVLNLIRAVITERAARGGVTRLKHVRSHSGGLDFPARMNERADRVANAARVAALGQHLPLVLYGDERYEMFVGRVPVYASYRRAILRELQSRVLQAWGERRRLPGAQVGAPGTPGPMAPRDPGAAHTSRLVANNPVGVRALAAAVAGTHDPFLLRFLAEVVSEWLPVERRLQVGQRLAGRGPHCKLCATRAGEVPVVESVRHVFQCPSPGAEGQMALLIADGLRVLHDAGVRVSGPCLVAPRPPFAVRGGVVRWVPVWFDVAGRHWMEVMLDRKYPLVGYRLQDPLGGVIGVLPDGLGQLLRRRRSGGGNGWEVRPLRVQEDLLDGMRLVLVRGALRVYRERCRRMDEWWSLPEQGPARGRLVALAEGRARARARNRDRREREAFVDRMVEKRVGRVQRLGLAGGGPAVAVGPEVSGVALALTLEPGGAEAGVGTNVRFCLSVTNTSSQPALEVAVAAPLPSGYEFVEADDVAYDAGTGLWAVSVVPQGGVRRVSLTALIRAEGHRLLYAQVIRRSGRRRVPIDYHAPLVYSPASDPSEERMGALFRKRGALPHY